MGKGGGGSSGGTQQVVNSTEIPSYIADRLKTGLGLAEDAIGYRDGSGNLALDPYMPYGGNRIAGFSPDEQQAFNATRGSVGAYNPYIQQATNYTQQGAKAYDSGIKDFFTNQYASNVTDEMARLSSKNLMENVLPGVNDTFISGGSFGGTRNTDFTQRAIENSQRELAGVQGRYLSDNEATANDNMSKALGRATAGGQQLAQIGNQLQSQQGIDLLRMGTIGQQQRDMSQRGLDMAYGDFQTQKDYPKEQARYLLDAARGINTAPQGNTYKVESASGANPYSQLAGIVAGGAKLAKGGKVKRKKKMATKKMVKKSAPKKKFKKKG